MVLKPNIGATDVATAERLIGRVRGLVDSMQPSSYHQSLRYGFGGRYPKVIQEFRTVVGDILRTTLLCVGLIGAVVLIYFRRLRMGWLMAVAVGVGTMAALAIARLTIGYLTVQSAFLGSIIVGNGINYSIILLARYIEERRDRDASSSDALTTALTQTWGPTCIAALTAAVSFGALGLTQMRGFSHFGFIGGIGMPLCWLATYVFVPAWLHCSERCWPTRFAAASEPFGRLFSPIGVWVVRKSRTVIAWSIGATVIALGIAGWYLPRSLEYNFNRLRFKPAAPQETWEEWARSRADEVFGQSASPAVILADRPGQVEAICAAVDGRGPALIGEDGQPIYDACKSILTYVPKEQETKLARLAEIRDMLSGSTLKFLTDEQRKEVEKFRESFALQPIGVEDLPKTLVDNFAEMDGRVGLVVYVYPQPAADLWHGKALIQFADLVRRVDLPGGETIHSSGEAVIFADLLRAVVREGPRLTLYSFCLVLLLVFVNFRERLACAYVMGSLAVGIVWLVAALAMAGVRLNFLNFVALPISFGIGVDYAVNIFQRYRQDGPGSVAQVVRHMGGAVFLCSLTTMIGYSVLLISRNQALNSFGLAALLGELTCLAAALVSLPAGIALAESRANARS
ncbi:MAG: MMPL family transporter [Deltaproteobacteria bacterium]|nr:MMPL family transporter [Deltaproteobacteria bacterium]